MHCMIAWGCPDPNAPLQPQEHAKIEAVLNGHGFVRAFPGSGVLTVAGNEQRLALEQQLVAVIRDGLVGRVQVLISPPMGAAGFLYRGFLPQAVWEPLNAKIQQ
jgi:hypothetical protein